MADIWDIVWNETAFSCLELAEEQKKVLQALVESQLGPTSDVPFDDFIAGKGRGIITLLQYVLPVAQTS